MEAQLTNKDERVEIRISSYDKRIFQKAQKLCGDKSFSSFIVEKMFLPMKIIEQIM